MIIYNRIEECADGRERPLDIERRVVAVIHRTGMGYTAEEISAAYQTHPQAGPIVGYQMPYTFVIGPDGEIEQALKLSDYGPHAKAWNSKGIGIGCIGDFRRHAPPAPQYKALVWLLGQIAAWLPGGASAIYGHDELRDAMADPNKICPGSYLDMHDLRADIRAELVGRLTGCGVVL